MSVLNEGSLRSGPNLNRMISTLSFGQLPPGTHATVSSSSSPQPSMASSSESPMGTPFFDSGMSSLTDNRSESQDDSGSTAGDIIPKIEERELSLSEVKTEWLAEETPISPTNPVRVRRGRGRPRLHPPKSPTTASKQAKARSKTGCGTCRKRKKKCDETKPECLSCLKNNIVCTGYPPVELWKSGKERAAEARRASQITKYELPPLMAGVESDLDRHLLQHFVNRASRALTLHDSPSTNPFTKILLPMALKHEGLMHSVLCLSASHLCSVQPSHEYDERRQYHRGKAFSLLNHDLDLQKAGENGCAIYEDHNVAQILLHLLDAVCDGDTSGEFRTHMRAAKKIAMTQRSKNPEFQTLFEEFFYYHYIASQITTLDNTEVPMMEDFNLPFQINPQTASLIGVSDGLFGFISKVSNLRRRIRNRIDNHVDPAMDYEALLDTSAIDRGLRDWVCPVEPGTHRYTVSMLYRQAVWVYLYRTAQPSKPHPHIKTAVDMGIRYINELPKDSWVQSNVLLPLFLIGCAAFEEQQRVEVTRAFNGVMASTGLGNISFAKEVVDRIWELMDAGHDDSWDWEKIIHSKEWDFLVT